MVHVCSSGKPEVVLFGDGVTLLPPFSLTAGPDLIVTAREGQQECTLTLTEMGGKPKKQRCSLKLADVLVRCTQMGGTYPDVVDLLRQAADGKNLDAKFVVDGLPRVVPWNNSRPRRWGSKQTCVPGSAWDATAREAPPRVFDLGKSGDRATTLRPFWGQFPWRPAQHTRTSFTARGARLFSCLAVK